METIKDPRKHHHLLNYFMLHHSFTTCTSLSFRFNSAFSGGVGWGRVSECWYWQKEDCKKQQYCSLDKLTIPHFYLRPSRHLKCCHCRMDFSPHWKLMADCRMLKAAWGDLWVRSGLAVVNLSGWGRWWGKKELWIQKLLLLANSSLSTWRDGYLWIQHYHLLLFTGPEFGNQNPEAGYFDSFPLSVGFWALTAVFVHVF